MERRLGGNGGTPMVSSILCAIHSPRPDDDIAFLCDFFNRVFETGQRQYSCETDRDNAHVLTWGQTTIVLVETAEPHVGVIELEGDWMLQKILDASSVIKHDGHDRDFSRLVPVVQFLDDLSKFATKIPVLTLPSGSRLLLAVDDKLRSAQRDFIVALQSKPADLDSWFAPIIVPTTTTTTKRKTPEDDHERQPRDRPLFPTLDMTMLKDDGTFVTFRPNAPEPIDVETDLFKGRIIVLLRPAQPERDDPYWHERVFAQKRRKIIIQIQGQFQRTPVGTVYAGAEVTDPMKLGFLTKGVCSVLLRLVEQFNNNIHYSYGDGDEELPHIVGPAYTFFQKFVATPPGETPPPVDQLFTEEHESDAASLKRRSTTSTVWSWNTTDTYSFSFYSMYIDLPVWKLVNVPAMGDLKLQTFWKDSLLRICMYETSVGAKQRHISRDNRYAFSIQAKFIENGQDILPEVEEDNNVLPWSRNTNDIKDVPSNASLDGSLDESQAFDVMARKGVAEDREEPELAFFDAEEGDDEDVRFASPHKSNLLLEKIDMLCPFWIERWNTVGGSERSYAVNIGRRTVLRTESDCGKIIQAASRQKLNHVLREHFSSRLSAHEKMRRSLGIVISNPKQCDVDEAKLAGLLSSPENSGADQLLALSTPELSNETVQGLEGPLARAISDRHWAEEWAKVSSAGQSLLFFRSSERKRPRFRLNLRLVSRVEEVDPSDRPHATGIRIMAVTSIGRTLYLMVKEGSCFDAWFRHLQRGCGRMPTNEDASDSPDVLRLFEIDSLEEEFMHNSSMWACKNRKILNSARFHFRQNATNQDAEGLSQDALRAAIDAQTFGLDDEIRRQRFLTAVSRLKTVSLVDASEKSKLAFFLNLYHTMITHAFLILGPPSSPLRWLNYFNTISYQVADDIFSVTELEHCILRSTSSPPTQFFSRFIIPNSKYHFKVAETFDVRINFALNCGSLSNPPTILLYNSTTLETQLDVAGTMFLKGVDWKRTSNGALTLHFPRLIQWYADDFGSNREQRLLCLSKYLPIRVQQEIKKASGCEIKYQAFNFECRSLELVETPMENS